MAAAGLRPPATSRRLASPPEHQQGATRRPEALPNVIELPFPRQRQEMEDAQVGMQDAKRRPGGASRKWFTRCDHVPGCYRQRSRSVNRALARHISNSY